MVCFAVGRVQGLFHLLEAPASFHRVPHSREEEGVSGVERDRDDRTPEHLVLEGGYVLPSICRPRAADSSEMGKNATGRVKHG